MLVHIRIDKILLICFGRKTIFFLEFVIHIMSMSDVCVISRDGSLIFRHCICRSHTPRWAQFQLGTLYGPYPVSENKEILVGMRKGRGF